MQRAKYTSLPTLFLLGTLLLPAPSVAAADPGSTLRAYLAARRQGDVAAAEKLWDPEDLRRTQALGTQYTGLEARFDDNLLQSAAERGTAALPRPAFRDSTLEAGWARYTVSLPMEAARADTVQYWLRKTGTDWRVTSPFARLTTNWTAREGRFYRLRASKLRAINKDALQSLDNGILAILDRLEASEQARLRLERIKIEYYLCDTDAEMRQLGVPAGASSYRLAGERVVSRQPVDLAAVSHALVHLVLKETPPVAAPVFEAGLAAALGGTSSAAAGVTLQRGIALATQKPADLDAVLEARTFYAMKRDAAVPLAGVWAETLLRELGAAKFLAMYRDVSATPAAAATMTAATVRPKVEAASGRKGPALTAWVRERAVRFTPPLAGGVAKLPEETRSHQPIMRWRDTAEKWALEVYDEGQDYVFVIGPYQGATPQWAQKMMDSLKVASGEKPDVVAHKPPPRPAGDPPQIAILIRERLAEPEAYESALYQKHFTRRAYAGDLFGLFIGPDTARLYDYRRDLLVGLQEPAVAIPGAPPYFDEKAGKLSFRLRRDLLPKPLTEYLAVTVLYTGE